MDRPGLDELIGRYLSPATPVHREDSTVEVMVDGREWMLRKRELLTSTGPATPCTSAASSSSTTWI